jgi:hypothetical protein
MRQEWENIVPAHSYFNQKSYLFQTVNMKFETSKVANSAEKAP